MLKRTITGLAAFVAVALGLTLTGGPALASTNYFYYAVGNQVINAAGMAANFTVDNPFLKTAAPAEAHTLAEMAVESADSKEIIEFGWHVDKAVNGDTLTRLWGARWVNGISGGYNVGFTDCTLALCGSNFSPFSLGDALTADVGTIKQFAVQHTATGDWFLSYNSKWVAYISDSTWNAGSCSCTLTQGAFFQVFGEVATGTAITSGKPCTDMGRGDLGVVGTGSASISAASYFGLATTAVNLSIFTTTTFPGSPSLAGIYTVAYTASSNQRSFGYGGPGYNSAGTAAGTKGSC